MCCLVGTPVWRNFTGGNQTDTKHFGPQYLTLQVPRLLLGFGPVQFRWTLVGGLNLVVWGFEPLVLVECQWTPPKQPNHQSSKVWVTLFWPSSKILAGAISRECGNEPGCLKETTSWNVCLGAAASLACGLVFLAHSQNTSTTRHSL